MRTRTIASRRTKARSLRSSTSPARSAALRLPTSRCHGRRRTVRCRRLVARLRAYIFSLCLAYNLTYPTHRIVAGLFLLVVPFIQWKGKKLRVRGLLSFHVHFTSLKHETGSLVSLIHSWYAVQRFTACPRILYVWSTKSMSWPWYARNDTMNHAIRGNTCSWI
jgi:hypothetical protein